MQIPLLSKVIKVTELDNPTNLGVSDFSLVAATLDTNNAYKFMSGIEGDLRFGKMCAEVKSWVIDMELPLVA